MQSGAAAATAEAERALAAGPERVGSSKRHVSAKEREAMRKGGGGPLLQLQQLRLSRGRWELGGHNVRRRGSSSSSSSSRGKGSSSRGRGRGSNSVGSSSHGSSNKGRKRGGWALVPQARLQGEKDPGRLRPRPRLLLLLRRASRGRPASEERRQKHRGCKTSMEAR